jgi:hypothetical protein
MAAAYEQLKNYTQYDIPETLKHKRFYLPQDIGTADYPIQGKVDRKNRRTLRTLWDDERHGPLYLRSQLMRYKRWVKTVRKYEADPRDFQRAWRYLNEHPIFYRFREWVITDEAPLTEILQERNLEHERGFDRIEFAVSRWCERGHNCEKRKEIADCGHRKTTVAWMEAGEWTWPADKDPEHPYEPRPGKHAYHDYRLDVYGTTYEACALQLAYRVWKLYGNDRRACHENR